jgi:hypothetical protein
MWSFTTCGLSSALITPSGAENKRQRDFPFTPKSDNIIARFGLFRKRDNPKAAQAIKLWRQASTPAVEGGILRPDWGEDGSTSPLKT